jgi:hypothetical protein
MSGIMDDSSESEATLDEHEAIELVEIGDQRLGFRAVESVSDVRSAHQELRGRDHRRAHRLSQNTPPQSAHPVK